MFYFSGKFKLLDFEHPTVSFYTDPVITSKIEDSTMALTEFGKAVRKARIDTDCTLLTMAQTLGVTPAFLSGLETGSKKIPKKWVKEIQGFFKARGYELNNLQELADVSNQFVSLDGLSQNQQMLVAGFAKSPLTPEQLKRIAELMKSINHFEG